MLQSVDLWLLSEKNLFIKIVPSVYLNDKSKVCLDDTIMRIQKFKPLNKLIFKKNYSVRLFIFFMYSPIL